MPFTPFHLGPSFWLGLLLFRFINIGAFLAGSVLVDVEPLVVMVFNLNYPLHGFLHSYLGGTIIAALFAILYYRLKVKINYILSRFRVAQDSSFSIILISCLLGVYFHIFLDSFLYTDIKPFFPLKMNPQYGLISSPLMYMFCAASFLVGGLFYVTMLIQGKWKGVLKVISAVFFIGFIIVMVGLSVLQWMPLFDDGPFTGLPFEGQVSGQASSSLEIEGKYRLEVYSRAEQEPVLVLRDKQKRVMWTRVLDVRNHKNYSNCRVGSLELFRFRRTFSGYHVQGMALWTYGREAANLYLRSNGDFDKFYLSW